MIPGKLTIDGLSWEIKVADVSFETHAETRAEECQCLIANRLSQQMQEVAFHHELIHMLIASRDWNPDPARLFTEESIATFLGPALYAFFKENALITWQL